MFGVDKVGMEERKFITPQFGPFAGIRIIGCGSLVAMPFAAGLLSDFGAEFIQIERPGIGDTMRGIAPIFTTEKGKVSSAWMQEARNRLSLGLELNMNEPHSREIFFGIISQSDVFIENMVWLDKFGIRDEDLLEANPKLVIVHVSGFGHEEFGGVPEICNQASYDIIGQAFSGYAYINGFEGGPPLTIKPYLNDYVTALFAVFGMLAALFDAQRTGIGQVVDVAQYESQMKLMRDAFTTNAFGLDFFTRSGNKGLGTQPWNMYETGDGEYVMIGAIGHKVFSRFMDAAGLSEDEFPYSEVGTGKEKINSENGKRFEQAVCDWCRSHSAEEIERMLRSHRVACSKVNSPADCLVNPQYIARKDFVEINDETTGMDITAVGIIPKMSKTPGRIWRGAPSLGQDTELILTELLGYSENDINDFRRMGIIN